MATSAIVSVSVSVIPLANGTGSPYLRREFPGEWREGRTVHNLPVQGDEATMSAIEDGG